MINIKIEEGKYYRTQDGRKVGPARKINDDFTWARWVSGGEILEVVGVRPEHAFHTKLVSEWTDDTPKLWRDMTDEEKGTLLLAHHEGKVIECYQDDQTPSFWAEVDPNWDGSCAFRVKPEPVRETVEMFGERGPKSRWCFGNNTQLDFDTHRITFDTIDGEPDCASIKMEKL